MKCCSSTNILSLFNSRCCFPIQGVVMKRQTRRCCFTICCLCSIQVLLFKKGFSKMVWFLAKGRVQCQGVVISFWSFRHLFEAFALFKIPRAMPLMAQNGTWALFPLFAARRAELWLQFSRIHSTWFVLRNCWIHFVAILFSKFLNFSHILNSFSSSLAGQNAVADWNVRL